MVVVVVVEVKVPVVAVPVSETSATEGGSTVNTEMEFVTPWLDNSLAASEANIIVVT
jgi:hypothetical protein